MVTAHRPRKVLVVDDESLIRQTLTFVLQDTYDVVAVGSGEEAIEASKKESFPVVILDLCMEGISGIETLRHLKKIRGEQNVIILTAYESMETAISALNLGAFNYLTKPFDRAHLRETIARAVELYEARTIRTEDMRERLMEVHDQFFSLLCHEFNTPLNTILGFADLLQASIDQPEFHSWAEHIKESGNHLHSILMEIVDYTAASHLAKAGVEKDFDLAQLLSPIFMDASDRKISITFEREKVAKGRFRGPSDAILAMVKKLVRIASHRSKQIRIACSLLRHDGPHLEIAVSGTGISQKSIGAGDMEKLFKPYQFAPKNDATGTATLGLELATCRKIADYSHATIEGRLDRNGEIEFVAQMPVTLLESYY